MRPLGCHSRRKTLMHGGECADGLPLQAFDWSSAQTTLGKSTYLRKRSRGCVRLKMSSVISSARMRAFALNERFALWLVKWRFDPWEASEALLGVSNTLHTYGGIRADPKQALERTLRFRITR
jgi:hypothetical protein